MQNENIFPHLSEYHKAFPNDPYFIMGKYIYKRRNGILWRKVFYHCSLNNIFYSNSTEARKTNEKQKYSILYELENQIQNKYEFLLEYPNTDPNHNCSLQWTQESNPVLTKDVIVGFSSKLKCDSGNALEFKGINLYDGYPFTYIAESRDSWWYFAIGSYAYWPTKSESTFPGPFEDYGVQYVNLWMKAPPSIPFSLTKDHVKHIFVQAKMRLFWFLFEK